jgi:hypothetical protein
MFRTAGRASEDQYLPPTANLPTTQQSYRALHPTNLIASFDNRSTVTLRQVGKHTTPKTKSSLTLNELLNFGIQP